MKTSEYLANRLREVLTDGKWVTGTNFKEQILNIDWKDAIETVYDLNSIAKLTFHIHYYIDGVTKVLQGGPLEIRDAFSFDAPPITSEEDWNKLTHRFCTDAEKLISIVGEMTEDKLSECFVYEKYGTYKRNIDVMIEHTNYHLGQILIIKKLINKKKTSPNTM
ncbi:DUF1572 domain-containing protein [Aquimarina hainanensis]|uniref:DUF1572 domain-containing protein n=1 Tax=Aquimarina hainanensis TaxID=1578017 RepID=A0ABW5N3D8_9FLAO